MTAATITGAGAHASAEATDHIPAMKAAVKGYLTPELIAAYVAGNARTISALFNFTTAPTINGEVIMTRAAVETVGGAKTFTAAVKMGQSSGPQVANPLFGWYKADGTRLAYAQAGDAGYLTIAMETVNQGINLVSNGSGAVLANGSAILTAATGVSKAGDTVTGVLSILNGGSFQLRVGANSSYNWSVSRAGSGDFTIAEVNGGVETTAFSLGTVTPTATFVAGIISGAAVRLKSYTVATLPAGVAGDLAFVTDAIATSITGLGLAPTGGGSNKVVVFYDTAWRII